VLHSSTKPIITYDKQLKVLDKIAARKRGLLTTSRDVYGLSDKPYRYVRDSKQFKQIGSGKKKRSKGRKSKSRGSRRYRR